MCATHRVSLIIRTHGQTGYSLEDYFDDQFRRGNQGRMVDLSDLVCAPIRRARNC